MDTKKKKIILIILSVLLVILIPTFVYTLITYININSDRSKNTNINNNNDNNDTPLVPIELSGDFDIDLFRQTFVSASEAKNTVISPLSIKIAMAMAAEGASGKTLSEIRDILGIDENTKLDVKQLIEQIENDEDITFDIANSFWGKEGLEFDLEYTNTLEQYYNAEVEEVDFSDLATNKLLNDWVSDETDDKITIIVPPDEDLTPYITVLMNAIYFNAKWSLPFDEEDTEKDNFTTIDGSETEVDMMYLNSEFDYYEDEQIQVISLPYGESEKYAMRVYLPKENVDFVDFVSDINAEKLSEWTEQFTYEEGMIKLPRFKIEYSNSGFVDILKKLGVKDAFLFGTADFTRMTVSRRSDIFIDKIIHKTYIDVTEEGTEAAAVTAIMMVGSMASPEEVVPFSMIVNSPFLFTIKDTEEGNILFIGAVTNPNQ
jgi:serpin B